MKDIKKFSQISKQIFPLNDEDSEESNLELKEENLQKKGK